MVFLNPAVLLGLLASSIPVIIHLLNLRKLKRIEFSTLAFLKELQKTKVRKIKLKQWLLLLLRVLIILLLVFSFARPALESASFSVASSAKTTAVIIIDNSFSMSYVDENGSLLNQAKAAANKLIDEFQEGDEVAILSISSLSREINTSGNKDILLNWAGEIDITNISSDLSELLLEAYNILNASKNFNRELYIFSDFQEGRFFNREELSISKLDQWKVYYMPLTGKSLKNLSVSSFEVKNQIFEINSPISFSCDITNNSSENSSNNVLSLFISGKRYAQNSFDIQAGETKRIEFETMLPSSGLLEIFVELEEDDILYDNKRYQNVYVPEKISVLALADNPDDLLFVTTALKSTGENYFDIKQDLTSRLNGYNLFNFEVVLLTGQNYSKNINKLEKYLEKGGSIIITPSNNADIVKFGELLASLKLPRPEAFVDNKNDGTYSTFEKIDYNHPVFANLFEKNIIEIESPFIYKYFRIFNRGKGKNIISLIDGSAFLSEYNLKNGRVLLFSAAPLFDWSDFPIKGIFAPLMNKAVFYLTFANSVIKNYLTGDELIVDGSKITQPPIKVTAPDNSQQYIQPDLGGFNNTFKYFDSETPGIYKFYSGDELFDHISVNVDPKESRIKYLDQEQIREILTDKIDNIDLIELDINDDLSQKIAQSRFGTELWKFFLAAALLIALIEMWLARNAKKDLAEL